MFAAGAPARRTAFGKEGNVVTSVPKGIVSYEFWQPAASKTSSDAGPDRRNIVTGRNIVTPV